MEFDLHRIYEKIGFSKEEQLEDMETHGVSTAIRRAETILILGMREEGNRVEIEVKKWQGMFFLSKSWHHDPDGPFDSLMEALDDDYFKTEVVDPEITSSRVSSRVLRKIGRQVVFDDGSVIRINGQDLVLKKGKLVLMKGNALRQTDAGAVLQDVARVAPKEKQRNEDAVGSKASTTAGNQAAGSVLIDHSKFNINLKPEGEHDDEGRRVSREEQVERLEARLPSGIFKIGSVTDEVENWRSWDCETHFYLLPLKEGDCTFALLTISWDDNWGRFDYYCVSRIKGEKKRWAAEIALIEDWIKTRGIDVSDESPFFSFFNELRR